jgi:GNAT superfamily N-acetyltransferase
LGLIGALRFKARLRRLRTLRVIALGVIPEYQKRGIESLLMEQAFRNGFERGYERAEMSWILEDNVLMNRAMQRLGGGVIKRYRIFEKTL